MTWDDVIEREKVKPYFHELVAFLRAEDQDKIVLPPREKRLAALRLTPLDSVKVVILGQDPYHDHGQAHGLSFSVEQGAYPPSLKNVFKELVDDLNIPYPRTGNLTKWAKQGVLLLNTVLTVELHRPFSHRNKGWEGMTSELIKEVARKDAPVVFILWGNNAKRYRSFVYRPQHLVLTAPHPSPLSANRGFFKSKPFSRTNRYLIEHGLDPIDWMLE
ncbi:MAG: uracil-DNA glycosylase [Acholeplasmataceae bacterium]